MAQNIDGSQTVCEHADPALTGFYWMAWTYSGVSGGVHEGLVRKEGAMHSKGWSFNFAL